MAIGADGSSYYRAREAIEQLKKEVKKNKKVPSDIRIEIEQDVNSISTMLNTIFSLTLVIRNNWTERQKEIIWEYDKVKGSQTECAKRLCISQSSVQRSLKNGNYYAYKQNWRSIICWEH